MKNIFSLTLLLTFCGSSFATVRNVPGTYTTIPNALLACVAGDTVLVQPGTYMANINWPNIPSIKLFSAGDSSNTIINGNNLGVVININAPAADTNTIIRGFKITGGFVNSTFSYAPGIQIVQGGVKVELCCLTGNNPGGSSTSYCFGTALYFGGSIAVLDGVSVRNNAGTSTGYGYGGAMYLETGATTYIRNSVIKNNTMTATNYCFGGGIYSEGNLNIRNSDVALNTMTSGGYHFGGGICFRAGTGTLVNVRVIGNALSGNANYFWGGGIYAEGASQVNLTNVLIASNTLGSNGFVNGGGGIHAEGTNTSVTGTQVTITDNKRTNNGTISGSGVQAESSGSITLMNSILYDVNNGAEVNNNSSTVNITYSDVRSGYTGTGNINVTPGFVSSTDFHLTVTSGCVALGTVSGSPLYDLDNSVRPLPVATNPDMGCYEVDQLTSAPLVEKENFAVQNFPNPFSAVTTIQFTLREASFVQLNVYNINGKLMKQLLNGNYPKNNFELEFDASELPAGLYCCTLIAGGRVEMIQLVKE
jgi:hypothetical protein